MAVSRRAGVMPARIRIPSYAVWEVAVFVLNVLAFILVGFQLKSIVLRMNRPLWLEYIWFGAAVCAATILARIAWVMMVAAFSRWRCRPRAGLRPPAHANPISSGAATLVGWCGMRGIVTLAAALALPTGGDGVPPFPYRDLILFTAFAVVLGTLVVQGMTLRPLLNRLRLEEDDTVDHEVRLARVETLRAALAATDASTRQGAAALVRTRYEMQLRRAEAAMASGDDGTTESTAAASRRTRTGDGGRSYLAEVDRSTEADAVRAVMAAEREKLIALRAQGTIGDAAFQQIEQDLDWTELDLEQLLRTE
jgi:CPA1 family monovalent cation:H+ antiporter